MAEQVSVIRWENPPATRAKGGGYGRPNSQYQALAEQLRSRQGVWALVSVRAEQNRAASLAGVIREGRTVCFGPRGDFDACTRAVDGMYRVYARYVGDNEE